MNSACEICSIGNNWPHWWPYWWHKAMESMRKAAGDNKDSVIGKPQESLTLAGMCKCICAFKYALNSERCDMIYGQTS